MKIAPFFLLTLFALSACTTTSDFAPPSGEWTTWHGQLRYTGTERPIIGEVVVRQAAPQEFQLEFLSGPGFPLLKLRTNGTTAAAEGAFARGRWSGSQSKPPSKLKAWIGLPAIFRDPESAPWPTEVERVNGEIRTLDVRVPETGERFQFNFDA